MRLSVLVDLGFQFKVGEIQAILGEEGLVMVLGNQRLKLNPEELEVCLRGLLSGKRDTVKSISDT